MDDNIVKSDIVIPMRGRDEGALMMVIDRLSDGYLLLADGRLRKIEHPKRKKDKHVRLVAHTDCRAALKLRNGEKLSNSEIRRAIADAANPPLTE